MTENDDLVKRIEAIPGIVASDLRRLRIQILTWQFIAGSWTFRIEGTGALVMTIFACTAGMITLYQIWRD